MGFKDHKVKSEYRSLIDNVVQDFYIPLLRESVSYKRAVGYFSSSALVEISKGIAEMASEGGKIQIVASPYLSDEDIEAIKKGYDDRNQIIEKALWAQIAEEPTDYYSMERLNLLASLIADGVMDIQIAYTEDQRGIGMYHEKMGIIEDTVGDKIAFSGSNNESATAMSVNYETMDVFRSWGDLSEVERVRLKENAFYSIWHDTEPNIKVLEFPNITDALIEKYRRRSPNFNIDKNQFARRMLTYATKISEMSREIEGPIGARVPADIELREYQKEAIASWVGENYRGIFDMATGTGKTLTGLSAITKISKDLNNKLAVVVVAPYQHLVDQWCEDIEKFNIAPIIGYSSSPQRNWLDRLKNAIFDQNLGVKNSEFFLFVCTNATFGLERTQAQLAKIKGDVLLLIDEAHNAGSASFENSLIQNISIG